MDGWFLIVAPDGWGLFLLRGAWLTLAVAACGMALGAVLGLTLACARIAGARWLRMLADAYTTVLRGVPDLLVIYLFYFGGSSILSALSGAFGHEGFAGMPTFATGALALGVVSAAYQAEVYRGAFQAVPRGQLEAARAMGFSGALMLRRIVVPQAWRHALPGLGNVWQLVIKESALVSVIGLVELLRAAQVGAGSTRLPFAFYTAALLLYLVITSASGLLLVRAEAHAQRPYRRA
ncbi:MAG: ABC transporter permease subunit [Burkholderiales bacterium]